MAIFVHLDRAHKLNYAPCSALDHRAKSKSSALDCVGVGTCRRITLPFPSTFSSLVSLWLTTCEAEILVPL